MHSDTELIKHVLAGGCDAKSDLVDHYGSLVYSALCRCCGIPETSLPEAFKFVFQKLFEDDSRRLRDWKGESALSTFLFAMTLSLARDFCENGNRPGGRADRKGGENRDNLHDSGTTAPEGEIIVSHMEKVIGDLVNSGEDVCRRIIDLRCRRNMSTKETALASGVPVGGVGARLHRCLEALARLMKTKFPDFFEDRFNLDM